MKEYVHDGTVKSVILWDTHALGALTIYASEAVVKGTLKPDVDNDGTKVAIEEYDSIKAGKKSA